MIGKNVPTRINTDDFELDLKPGEYNDALNVITFSGNTGGLRKSIAVGNTKITAVFPGLIAGAKCIGSAHQTLQRRSIVIFYQAPNIRIYLVDHSVSFIDVTVTLLVNSPNYGVNATSFLQGSFFVDDLFYFNFDDASPKVINIQRALSQVGFYDSLPEQAMSVIKPRPAYSPLVERTQSASNVQNASFLASLAPWLGSGWTAGSPDRAVYSVSFVNNPAVEPALNTNPYFKGGATGWSSVAGGAWTIVSGFMQSIPINLGSGSAILINASQSYGAAGVTPFIVRLRGKVTNPNANTPTIRLIIRAITATGTILKLYGNIDFIIAASSDTNFDVSLTCDPSTLTPPDVHNSVEAQVIIGPGTNCLVKLSAFTVEKQTNILYQNGVNIIAGARNFSLQAPLQTDGYTTLRYIGRAFDGSPLGTGEDYAITSIALSVAPVAVTPVVNFTAARSNFGIYINYSQPDVVGDTGFGNGALLLDVFGLVASGLVDQPIQRKAYQFFDTFVYLDGENSVLSPASEFLNAIDDSDATGTFDAINVIIRFQSEIYPVISDVVLLVRNDNDFDAIRTVVTIPKNLFTLIGNIYQYPYRFNDQINGILVPRSFALRPFDAIPRLTDYIAFLKGRMFLPDTLVDYNIEDTWALQVTVAKGAGYGDDRSPAGFTIYTQSTFMDDSEYSTCLVFFDKFGRRIPPTKGFVKIITPRFVPKALPLDNPPGTAQGLLKDIASYTITGPGGTGVGVPPSYAFYWTFSRSKNIKWEFKICRKCILRFPYSTTPYDGVSAKPANTFVEDGYLYWDFQAINASGNQASRNNMSNDFIDIIVPSNFPFPIDNNILIDFHTQLHSSTVANAVTILDRDVVLIFSNKIRIRGDSRMRWLKTAAQAGPYTTNPKFFSGVNLIAGQTLNQDEFAMPVIFKRKASTNLAELLHYDEPNTYAVVNPGTAERSFGGTAVGQEDVYNTIKGVVGANYPIPVNQSVLQPFLVAPDTIHSNQRLVVDWATVNTGFSIFTIDIQLFSLNQSTQQPITMLAARTGAPAGQGSVEYALTGFPDLTPGWYGYAIKMNPPIVPQYPDEDFSEGLTFWSQGPLTLPQSFYVWVPATTGSEFYVTFGEGHQNYLPVAPDFTPSIYWVLNIAFSLISLEVDIETTGILGPPTNTPSVIPSTTDGGIQVEFGGNQSAIMPVFITVNPGETVEINSVDIDIPNTITNVDQFASLEFWNLEAGTKKPLSLLRMGTSNPWTSAGVKNQTPTSGPVKLTTSGYIGIGYKIVNALIATQFTNQSFASGGAGWTTQGTGSAWSFAEPFAINNNAGGSANKSIQIGQAGVNVIGTVTVKINLSVAKSVQIQLFSAGESTARGSTGTVALPAGDSIMTINLTNGTTVGAFLNVIISQAGAVVVKISEITNVVANKLRIRGNAASVEKFWLLNGGVWTEDTRGLPWGVNVATKGFAAPANVFIQPQNSSNVALGPSVAVAPNIRTTVLLTLTSGLPAGGYGVAVQNGAGNNSSSGVGHVKLFRISTVGTSPTPPAIKTYAVTNPTYKAWTYGGVSWAVSTFVTGFSLKVHDVAISALVAQAVRPDSYAVTQNYLAEENPGHSTPWGNAPYTSIGFPYPSMASDPDALGITYLEKVVQSIGYPNIKVDNVHETHRGNEIRWSDTIVEGSKTNNLNSFSEENKFVLDFSRGPVRVLLPMHDNTLLAVHEAAMTSLYVEKVVLSDAQGTDNLLASTDKVLQAERQLYTNMGTLNPESCIVVESGLIAYGYDLRRMSLWKKSNNGVDNLTIMGKARKLFEQLSLPRIFAFQQGIDVKIYTGYDEYLKALYITFAPVTVNGVTYPAETVCWSELVQGFVSRFSFKPDAYLILKGSFYTVKAEGVEPPTLWFHGRTGFYNTFYNVAYTSLMKLVFMDQGDIKKIFNSMAVDSNKPWKVTRIETEEGNISSLDYSNFVLRDGRHYSTLLRDENTEPASLAPGQTPRLHGDKLVGKWVKMTIVNEITTEQVVLDAVYLGYDGLSGHLLQNKP